MDEKDIGDMEEARVSGSLPVDRLMESVPFAVLLVRSSSGKIVFANRKALAMFQYSPEEVKGMQIESLVPEKFRERHFSHRENFRERPRNRPMGIGMDLVAVRKNGTEFSVEIALSGTELSGEQFIMCFISDISVRKRMEEENRQLVAQLQHALDEVRKLSGLLPICSSCKKIRDDAGRWTAIENYIVDHSDTEFSHGICPDCAERLYPQYFGKDN